MSTRARIGIVNPDGSITSIYTHNDGYVSHHGPILLKHYNTPTEIRALLELGDLSRLAGELGSKHDFDSSYEHHQGWCCAYGRDRGQTSPAHTSSVEGDDVLTDEEYAYLFKDGKWSVWGAGDGEPSWEDLVLETILERLTA